MPIAVSDGNPAGLGVKHARGYCEEVGGPLRIPAGLIY